MAGTGTSFLGNIGALTLAVSRLFGMILALSVTYYKGDKESNEFNKQLSLIGSYAGRTTPQLYNLAKAISGNGITRGDAAVALAKVVGSGSFGRNQLEMITRSAVKLAQVSEKLMNVIDQLNAKEGKGTLFFAGQGIQQKRQMKREMLSP
ncbi:phage tail length tape measure family protein [Enterobacter soli]|uniref:phage tail length tape measure family protein n=1 Tax=Enterobacter soli TaxID=885040 RepID=UPI003EDB1522